MSSILKCITAGAVNGGAKPVVFYDGGCPMCRREIEHYRRIERTRRRLWLVISREPGTVSCYGLTVEQAMQRFHFLDARGRWSVSNETG